MKNLFLALMVGCAFSALPAQTPSSHVTERYSYVRIHLRAENDFERLQRLGIDLDHAHGKRGASVEAFLQPHELERLRSNGFACDILIADWDQHYAAQKKFSSTELKALQAPSRVKGFRLGSMGGFYTFDEVVAALDSMRLSYPALISQKTSLGKTVENREIWMAKISSSPDAARDKPEVLYFALIHAREPESMMALMYFMYYLLEHYGADPEVTYLLDNRELYFIPVMNPDGYAYNQRTRPNGGGLWRKNRRANFGGSFGVDLNRNFGFKWGWDDRGSSSFATSETYRGTAPFSEPELQALRNFCRSRKFRVALNFHAYGNLFIYPFGYDDIETPDSLVFRDFANEATRKSGYTYGTAAQTVNYLVNGDSDDWLYGEQSEKPKIIATTIEVGTPQDGFWPSRPRILPLVEENLHSNFHTAWMAGVYVVPVELALSKEFPQIGDHVTFSVKLQNHGLAAPATTPMIELATESPYLKPVGAASYEVRPGYKQGEYVTLNVKAHQDGFAVVRAFTFQLGAGQVLLADDAEKDKGLWRFLGGWGRDSSLAYQGKFSFKDRPYANSLNAANAEMILSQPFDFTNIISAKLEFHTRYAIEAGYDFGQVLASTDGGNTWQALKGKLMGPGDGNALQPYLEPGYDGIRHNWEKEEITLDAFAGKRQVLIKFRFRSDSGVTGRGWYVDNIRVSGYAAGATAVASGETATLSFALEQNYPNPFRLNSSTRIRFALPQRELVTLKVFDLLGHEVATLVDGRLEAGAHIVVFATKELPNGIYFYRLVTPHRVAQNKMLLIR